MNSNLTNRQRPLSYPKHTTNMKLLIISCVTEDQKQVTSILKKEGVSMYSTITAAEFDDNQTTNLKDGWFGIEKEHTSSTLFVCFTSNEKAEATFEHINRYNQTLCDEDGYLIKANIVAVEKSNLE